MNAAIAARAGAVLIAMAAALDPSWTRDRIVPVPIAVVHDGRSSAFAARLRRELSPEFDLTDGPAPASKATVLLRARDGALPRVPARGNVFVVDDPSRTPPVRIQSIDVPHAAVAGRALSVRATVETPDALDAGMTIELRAAGDLVAREQRDARARGRIDVALTFVPATTGVLPLQLEVRTGAGTAQAGAAVRVENRRLRVVFLDPRPSWASTFVRRALEEDQAFDVSASTAVSRGVSVTRGTTASILSAGERENIDAIVTGTPSALSGAEAAALASFARDRGGAVILLADSDAAGTLERFTGTVWRVREHTIEPVAPPAAAATLAPHVHEFVTGAGRIIVGGAIDAWRQRAAPGSTFAPLWRGVIGDAALAARTPLSVKVTPLRANPGQMVQAEVVLRGARAGDSIGIEGVIEADGGRETVRLWPSPAPGVFTARFPAPDRTGAARLAVTANAGEQTLTAEAPLLVEPSEPLANVPMGVPIVLMSARDGAYIADGNPEALRNDLRLAFPEHRAPVTGHPMRYAWWIAPFTLLLGYEWRWRRQRGLK